MSSSRLKEPSLKGRPSFPKLDYFYLSQKERSRCWLFSMRRREKTFLLKLKGNDSQEKCLPRLQFISKFEVKTRARSQFPFKLELERARKLRALSFGLHQALSIKHEHLLQARHLS